MKIFFRILMIMIMCAGILIAPGVSESDISVIRDIHPVNGPEQGLMEVTLTLIGFEKGGIIETLPKGVVFKSSSMANHTISQSGNNLIFAVLNESKIQYLVQTSDSVYPDITGKWEDILSEKRGEVISSDSGSLPVPPDLPIQKASKSPGFELNAVICALLIIMGIIWRVRE